MTTLVTALIGQRKTVRVVLAALLTAGAVGGWATSTMFVASPAVVGGLSPFDTMSKSDMSKLSLEELKSGLIGSYVVTGTDADGKAYVGASMVDIALAPSGALELDWDNGKQVGVGRVIGNILAVASLTKGRTAIMAMNINPDGSLSGKWSRRTDRGYKGTETWKKA
jgi:hypothetical protein